MFDNALNTKQQGAIGVSVAIAYFIQKGFPVFLPVVDTQDYDIIVDDQIKLIKVEVKTTRTKASSGNYIVCLKSSGGTKGFAYNTVSDSRADALFILAEDGSTWFLPSVLGLPSSSMTLNSAYDKFKCTRNI